MVYIFWIWFKFFWYMGVFLIGILDFDDFSGVRGMRFFIKVFGLIIVEKESLVESKNSF